MTATGPALDLVALVRELVRRPTVSGDAGAQRDVLGTLTEVLRERAPHLQVTEGRDRDHPWTLLRTPADPGRRQLLLDEPTNNLDPASREQVLDALRTYAGAIVLVTHDEGAVRALDPDKVILLPDGTEDAWSEDLADLVELA